MVILVVEDDMTLSKNLCELLEGAGHTTFSCTGQDQALVLFDAHQSELDIALLDISLAQGNGFTLCHALKERDKQFPIIFLTASDDELNCVLGLSIGADDYIAKPFRPRELLARLEVAARKYSRNISQVISIDGLTIDVNRGHITRDGETLHLSALEYKLLLLFVTHPNKLIDKTMIREVLWDDTAAYVEENTIAVHIKRLRDKIERDPQNPVIIQTLRGLGYRLDLP